MKCNTGGEDRAVRAVAGLVLGALTQVTGVGGALQAILLGVAGILVATAAVGFCPLYTLLRLNTCRTLV